MSWSNITKRTLLFGLGFLSAWAGYLQLNDADALIWVVVYGITAAIVFIEAFGYQVRATISTTVSIGYLLGAAYLAWLIFILGDTRPMFEDAQETGTLLATEEGRELIGLLFNVLAIRISRRLRWRSHSS